MIIIGCLLIFLLASLLSPVAVRAVRDNRLGWLLALAPLTTLCLILYQTPDIADGKVIQFALPWFKTPGISFSFRLDGLSQLFTLLISGIGLPIVIYSKPYFENNPYLGRYYFILFIFMLSMFGTVCADDLITLFVFWEITSVCSFLLIGLNHRHRTARKAAIEALYITTLGGLCLLASFILLAQITDTQKISQLITNYALIYNHPYFPWILILFFIGVFTKSAQFPFDFWLPGAMKAPTPVSAYLHSATLVQLGIYLLARFHPLFAESQLWFISLTTIGGITMLISALAAFRQLDMKLTLAYTTITALGSLVFTLASDHFLTTKAAVAFLLVHALYKANLFMAVGDIQHQTGSRHLKKIGGLHRAMPVTFLAVCVAGASMAGLPPLLGFYIKELVYEASLTAPIASHILTFVVLFANMMMAAIAYVLILGPFWGKQRPLQVKEANFNMSVNALLVAIITLLLSIFPASLDYYILTPATETILGRQEDVALLPGGAEMTSSLVLSLITISGAVLLYINRHWIRELLDTFRQLRGVSPQRILQSALKGSLWIAKQWTLFWQSGYLNRYITLTLLTLSIPLSILLTADLPLYLDPIIKPSDWLLWVLFLWLVLPSVSLLFVSQFLSGLIALGVFGLGLSFFFVIQGSPDLAMTQALIETLMVILIIFSLSGLPQWPTIQSETQWHRLSRATIAISLGLLIAIMVDKLWPQPFNSEVSDYFINHSLTLGHGRNIVNVILVNFRALDTLGEALVLLIAAIGIYFLLQYRLGKEQ